MQPRFCYVVGEPILTQDFDRFHREHDVALYNDYPITISDVRDSIGNRVTVYDDYGSVLKYQSAQYGQGCESFTRPQYKLPIFSVYVVDPGALVSQDSNSYKTSRANIIIQGVSICKESYTRAFYPSSYVALVPHPRMQNEDDVVLSNIKALFNDYAHPKFGLFLTLHWNRHHTALADRVRDSLPNTIAEAWSFLMSQRQSIILDKKNVNLNGSFLRRIDFALGRLIEQMDQNQQHVPALKK